MRRPPQKVAIIKCHTTQARKAAANAPSRTTANAPLVATGMVAALLRLLRAEGDGDELDADAAEEDEELAADGDEELEELAAGGVYLTSVTSGSYIK